MPNSIQYRYAKLLLCAAFALVMNPVWHALGHSISDHHSHEHEHHETSIQWTEQDLCPYCDAVSHQAVFDESEVSTGVLTFFWNIESFEVVYSDPCLILPCRPRAPPILV